MYTLYTIRYIHHLCTPSYTPPGIPTTYVHHPYTTRYTHHPTTPGYTQHSSRTPSTSALATSLRCEGALGSTRQTSLGGKEKEEPGKLFLSRKEGTLHVVTPGFATITSERSDRPGRKYQTGGQGRGIWAGGYPFVTPTSMRHVVCPRS